MLHCLMAAIIFIFLTQQINLKAQMTNYCILMVSVPKDCQKGSTTVIKHHNQQALGKIEAKIIHLSFLKKYWK